MLTIPARFPSLISWRKLSSRNALIATRPTKPSSNVISYTRKITCPDAMNVPSLLYMFFFLNFLFCEACYGILQTYEASSHPPFLVQESPVDVCHPVNPGPFEFLRSYLP